MKRFISTTPRLSRVGAVARGLSLILGLSLVVAAPAFSQAEKQFADSMAKYLASPDGQKALGKTVEDYFQKRQEEMVKEREAKQKNDIEEQFKNPVKIEVGKSPVKGPASAKITLIEFSDFQCPYCKRGYDTVKQIMESYPNDVKVAFKHLPLEFHKEAMPAAKASLAAAKQGKFWEYQSALFENQAKLSAAFYEETAKTLGLNIEQWKKDAASPEVEAQIKEDMALGAQNGIQGTPGFFVNGVAVKGAYPFEHFKMIIDRHLGKK